MAARITPLEQYDELAAAIGISKLYFKREDLHPYGSHKGRSIPVMIDKYYKAGDRRFAISSSGNAALAAALYIKELGERRKEKGENPDIDLDIFVGNHVAPHKLEKLREIATESNTDNSNADNQTETGHIRILVKERPLQALTQEVNEGARSLRQSTDDTALIGYESLAEELVTAGAIFIGTSSGTTAQALASYFLGKTAAFKISASKNRLCPQIHIVQTSSCHPLSDAFGLYEGPDERSDADAITDIAAQRKSVLIPLIEKTGGRGWFATNENIKIAQKLVKKHTGLDISTNSALSVVGAMQAVYAGHEIKSPAICLICGD